MPVAAFGQKINLGGKNFFRLTSKGEKIKFRFAGGAIYEGKHFIESEGKTIVSFCPRIMNDQSCDYCNKSFEYKKLAKDEEDANKKKKIEEDARKYSVKISFYYPIVDREEHKAKILQTVLTVRNNIEEEVRAGVDVLENDYILTRTETSPANFYSLVRAPKNEELSKEEQEELKKAKSFDIALILGHGKESDLKLGETDDIDKVIDEVFGDDIQNK